MNSDYFVVVVVVVDCFVVVLVDQAVESTDETRSGSVRYSRRKRRETRERKLTTIGFGQLIEDDPKMRNFSVS